ncbi:MAG TPA: DinB family protein [Amycolatopsis sp.]|nr:DinB family protein [Amycolatopsis sp.]
MVEIPKHLSPTAVGERTPMPRLAGERESLIAMLEWHRQTFALKCADLGQEALSRKAVPTSGLSLHGMLRHLTDGERWWFRLQFAGEHVPLLYYSDDDPNHDFDGLDGDIAEAHDRWRAECDHSRAIVAAASLDDRGTALTTGEPFTLRWLLLHTIAEYARHNGHTDLLREAIDGTTGH